MRLIEHWLWNVFVAASRLVSSLLGGYYDESLSGRMGRVQCRLCRLVCGLLDWIDPGHCEKADKHGQ